MLEKLPLGTLYYGLRLELETLLFFPEAAEVLTAMVFLGLNYLALETFPSLSNIRIDYTLTNSNPYIQILGPENASLQTSNSVILQFKIFDAELDKINVSIYGDGNLIYSANELDNNTLVSYNWT